MGRLWGWVVVVGVLMALHAAPAGAAEAPAEAEPTPAEVAAELPTPSCAEGPRRDGEVIVGTDCADTIVVPATVIYVNGGPGNDVIVGSQTGAVLHESYRVGLVPPRLLPAIVPVELGNQVV